MIKNNPFFFIVQKLFSAKLREEMRRNANKHEIAKYYNTLVTDLVYKKKVSH